MLGVLWNDCRRINDKPTALAHVGQSKEKDNKKHSLHTTTGRRRKRRHRPAPPSLQPRGCPRRRWLAARRRRRGRRRRRQKCRSATRVLGGWCGGERRGGSPPLREGSLVKEMREQTVGKGAGGGGAGGAESRIDSCWGRVGPVRTSTVGARFREMTALSGHVLVFDRRPSAAPRVQCAEIL